MGPQVIDETPLQKLQTVLEQQGVLPVLRILNKRAPHRFTAVYRYDAAILRNIHLVDAYHPALERGDDVALEDAYCDLLSERRPSLAFGAPADVPGLPQLASPTVSYCGVLLIKADGTPYGSLCHFDLMRCERPTSEMALLASVAPLIMATIEARR